MSMQVVLADDQLVVLEMDSSSLDPSEEAAAQGAWIIRHQPFSENNREIGYEVMRQMLQEAGLPWPRADEDAPAIEAMLEAVEAGRISVPRFGDWVRLLLATA
jgi:hypothetical protein